VRFTASITFHPLEELIQITQKTVKNNDCCAAAVNERLLMMQLSSGLLCASFNNGSTPCSKAAQWLQAGKFLELYRLNSQAYLGGNSFAACFCPFEV